MSTHKAEQDENLKYQEFIASEMDHSKEIFCPFRREKQFDFLFPVIKSRIQDGCTELLDLCCGEGRLIYFLQQEFTSLNIFGIDYFEPLLSRAKERFKNDHRTQFELANAMDLPSKFCKQFDTTIIHKTVSWLPYYKNIIEEAIKVTKKSIIITSLFCEGDLDFITKIYKNASKADDIFVYLNTYSLPKFKQFCFSLGVKDVKITPMKIDIDLPKNPDKDALGTHTERLSTGERLELTGSVVLNWKLLELIL